MAMMPIDDGATDGQANSHSIRLRCIERIEELVGILGIYANTNVAYAQAHMTVFGVLGPDDDLAWAVSNVRHRVGGVQ